MSLISFDPPSDVFRRYQKKSVSCNGLMNFNILKKNRDKTAKVEGSKKKYYSHLSGTTSDDKRTLKAYSTILKTFLNYNNLP